MRWGILAILLAQPAGWKPPAVRIQDEGTTKGYASTLNCTGAGIVCSVGASVATVAVSGGGGGGGSPGGSSGNVQINSAGSFGAYTGTSCTYAVKSLDANAAATCTAAPTIPLPVGTGAEIQTRASASAFGTYAGTSCAYAVKTLGVDGAATCTAAPTIPADISAKKYIIQTADAALPNAQATGALGTGLLKSTTTTGVLSIAVAGTDYAGITSGSNILLGNGAGGFSNYAGATSCTNQFFTGLSSAGASTCTTDTLASAQHANQGTTTTLLHGNAAGNPAFTGVALADFVANLGTTTTVLHGNAAGQPSYGAVSLTADVTGVLPAANGGTGTSQGLGGCVTLGTATGATTTVGPVVWTGTYSVLEINYEIAGYNGGTPVGRILVGSASISTTALTNGTSASEGIAGTLTNSVSIPGAPLAVTLSAIARSGVLSMRGRSGALKHYKILGQNGNPSVSVVPTLYRAVGNFSDLGTNLPIQRAQLTVYDTLTATAASAQAFLTGTTITVIGCP